MSAAGTEPVRFGPDGLAPVVVQDAVSGDVLMLAYMNDEAWRLTRQTGLVHYWSRGRGQLWRKGETSGNTQAVQETLVNCERNSILLRVLQTGAVCHDGYPTCFYRRVESDDSLTVVRAREFDPAEVYGAAARPAASGEEEVDPLAEATRQQFAAYAYLRGHDLTAVSGTSRLLHDHDAKIASRIADELRELAGVLTGEHQHAGQKSDLVLEASQVIYWVIVQALRAGTTWSQLRPDRALSTGEDDVSAATVARMLRAEADAWDERQGGVSRAAAHAHATLALVGQACHSLGVAPLNVINADLTELRGRPYLAPFFAGASA